MEDDDQVVMGKEGSNAEVSTQKGHLVIERWTRTGHQREHQEWWS